MCPSLCSRHGSRAGTIAIVNTLFSPTAASSLMEEPQSPQPPCLARSWSRNRSLTPGRGPKASSPKPRRDPFPSTLLGSHRRKKSETLENSGIGHVLFLLVRDILASSQPKVPHLQLHVFIDEEVACKSRVMRHHKSLGDSLLPTQHHVPTTALTKLEVSVQNALEVKVFQA